MMNRDDWAVGVILSASVHPVSGGHIGPPLQCVGRVEGGNLLPVEFCRSEDGRKLPKCIIFARQMMQMYGYSTA